MKKTFKTKKKDYFGLNYLVSIILAIIPFTSWILGALTRFKDKCIVAGILRLIGLGFIMWIADLISLLLNGKIIRLLNI